MFKYVWVTQFQTDIYPDYGCLKWLIMVYKLCTALGSSIAIAMVLLVTSISKSWATEYVFTAPPEVEREVVEIPASDEEYPLYECDSPSDDALDSHDCTCTDCDEIEQSQSEELESSLENEADRE